MPSCAVLGLIPARGGSKGVPRKNIRALGNRPLIQWTIDAALESRQLADVVVTTDDPEIAAISSAAGARVPFIRPATLAVDGAATLPVIQHAVSQLAGMGQRYRAVCLLQPTTPFRTTADIDQAVKEFWQTHSTSLISVQRIPADYHPSWALIRTTDGQARWASGAYDPPPRRQTLPEAFHRDGAIYITLTEVVESGSLYGDRISVIELDNPRISVNIDTLEDWARAERALFASEH